MHRQYDWNKSSTAIRIKSKGTPLREQDKVEEVTIGFGTGVVTGPFVRDHVCLGDESNASHQRKGCLEMHVIMARNMSDQPFKSFIFDGILGLGLTPLALTTMFSFFDQLSKSGQVAAPQFSVFLTDGEDGEQSEIALGGVNPSRIMGELSWSPVVFPEHGHWMIAITAVRVNGELLDICEDGTCRGVVDTGTSHIGVPLAHEKALFKMLAVDAEDYLDCRLIEAPVLQIEVLGANLTVGAENYMRRMPLREGVNVGSTIVSTDLDEAAGKHNRSEYVDVDVNATDRKSVV